MQPPFATLLLDHLKHITHQQIAKRNATRTDGGGIRTTCCQTTTSHKARDYAVPGIFLLSIAFHSAIEGREHPTPDAEVTAGDRCPRLDG